MHYPPVPPGQGFKSSLTGSGSETLKRSNPEVSSSCSHLKARQAGGSASKLPPHHVGFSIGSLMIWRLASSKVGEQLDRSCNNPSNLISEATSLLCLPLFMGTNPGTLWERSVKGYEFQKVGIIGEHAGGGLPCSLASVSSSID